MFHRHEWSERPSEVVIILDGRHLATELLVKECPCGKIEGYVILTGGQHRSLKDYPWASFFERVLGEVTPTSAPTVERGTE